MNIETNISNINNLSEKDTKNLSFRNFINIFSNNSKHISTIDITSTNGNPEKPHVRPYLFPYMWSVRHTHGVLGCRHRGVRKTTTADKNNNSNSNNDNNNRNNCNCNYNYNRYNVFTKHVSHASICSLTPRQCLGLGLKNPIYKRTSLLACHLVSLFSITVLLSCTHGSYVYRVEYNDGTVEYYTEKPDTASETTENVKETKRIRTDEINNYENQ